MNDDELDSHLITETERLLIRTLGEGDEPDFIALCESDDFAAAGSDRYRDMTSEKAAAFRLTEAERFRRARLGRFGVFRKADDPSELPELIGIAGIFEMEKAFADSVEFGFRIRSSDRGLGYGSEAAQAVARYAFGTLELSQLLATVTDDNAASRRTLEKCGYLYVGNVVYHEKSLRLYCLESDRPPNNLIDLDSRRDPSRGKSHP